MNLRIVFGTLGNALAVLSILLLPSAAVSAIYGERSFFSIVAVAAGSFLIGFILKKVTRTGNKVIYAKEGFAVVALVWVFLSLVGALPFVISGEIPSYVDALFETASGLTTTGATVLSDVSSLSHGLQFWRCFTHWIGGMGVLVLIMAVTKSTTDRSIHIMRAEMPGPVIGKLMPKAVDTAKILYIIYIGMTAAEIIMLMCGGMSLYESVIHAFSTAGTGGFSNNPDSLAGYSSYIHWVVTVFMALFGINFNLYYLLLIGKVKSAVKSGELWCYVSVILVSTGLIFWNIRGLFASDSEAVKTAAFQVSSIITTTGLAVTDMNAWPTFSKTIIVTLMLMGGCAGSTAGGLKISRAIMLIKIAGRELKKLLHPRSVKAVRAEGKQVDEATLSSVSAYFTVYSLCLIVIILLLSLDKFNFETNVTAAVSCFNNVGPVFGNIVPAGTFGGFSVFSKLILTFAMLLGRLEIFPLVIWLAPKTWSKN